MRSIDILAICCSDVHLSLRPPIARAEEENWLEAMARPWRQISALAKEHDCPVIVAGDLFDRWNPPVELVNWALDNLPPLLGIPGNHDLPSHRHKGQHRSAWGTLVRAGKIHELSSSVYHTGKINIYGFPFGGKVTPPLAVDRMSIAVIHEFMWTNEGNGFHGVSKKLKLTKGDKRFDGYDVVIVGDNHIAFEQELKNGTTVVNTGTLMRRKSNEAHYTPRVALLHADGVISHELDITEDVLTVVVKDEDEADNSGVSKFIEQLVGLQSTCLDYRDTLIAAMEHQKVPDDVKEALMEALDG